MVGSLTGNAEAERAQQAARQAELLASEAKKGEVEEKHKTNEVPACLVTGRHAYLRAAAPAADPGRKFLRTALVRSKREKETCGSPTW